MHASFPIPLSHYLTLHFSSLPWHPLLLQAPFGHPPPQLKVKEPLNLHAHLLLRKKVQLYPQPAFSLPALRALLLLLSLSLSEEYRVADSFVSYFNSCLVSLCLQTKQHPGRGRQWASGDRHSNHWVLAPPAGHRPPRRATSSVRHGALDRQPSYSHKPLTLTNC